MTGTSPARAGMAGHSGTTGVRRIARGSGGRRTWAERPVDTERLGHAGSRNCCAEPQRRNNERMLRTDAGRLLGGRLAPVGCTAAFIDRTADEVRTEIESLRGRTQLQVTGPIDFEEALVRLDPMEAPWTSEVVADCGGWTCYANNGLNGGDPTAIAPAVALRMSATCITAVHMPPYGPGHASTQLWLQGPGGEPPLMYIRTLAAHCEDGRWSWHESGEIQPFEEPHRYTARLKRTRLDRPLLIEYLSALTIDVDNDSFFGPAWLMHQKVDWRTRRQSAAQFRTENGWP